MELNNKYELLKHSLSKLASVVVAFSGGVDSTFLLRTAYDVLGDNVIAVTVEGSMIPERERLLATAYAKNLGVKHITFKLDEFNIESFSQNPTNRCYFCKKAILTKIRAIADENNILSIIEGSNIDDISDYRPGMQAVKEIGVLSPLQEANLTKGEIRILSQQLGLITWDKPSLACLASRIPYGQTITAEKLDMVDKAEQFLLDLGFKQLRVRHHGEIARIEISEQQIANFLDLKLMNRVNDAFTKIGFTYTALDLKGYRMGSMNIYIPLNN